MKCVKCGTEYEGNECPRCNGPVIKINSSDYMARRKAYEESLARKEIQKVLDSAEEACNVLSGESEQSDKDGKTIQQGKRAKKRSNKVKNYDEGVFDITKVDFNDPEMGMEWPIEGKDAIHSERDLQLMSISEYEKNPISMS